METFKNINKYNTLQRREDGRIFLDIRCMSNQTSEHGTRPFKGESGRRAVAQTCLVAQKCLRPRQHSPIKKRLRRHAINLAPPWSVKAPEDGLLRPEEIQTRDVNAGLPQHPHHAASIE